LKVLLNLIVWSVATLLLLQFVKIDVPPPPEATPKDEIKAPKKIINLLKRSCYDCHSNNTKWPWYSKISPISIQIDSNVKNGRAWLNFSIFNKYNQKKQQERYKKIIESLNIKMPPAEYLLIHKNARLTPKERETLKNWAKSQIKD